jgi:ribosomal protein L5
MARLQQHYREKVAPEMMAKFGYSSPMQVPRLSKITLNMGVSEAVADKKVMDHAVSDLAKIAGQKPVVTKSKKAIAGFKIREDQAIGCMVTLRGVQMFEFLDRDTLGAAVTRRGILRKKLDDIEGAITRIERPLADKKTRLTDLTERLRPKISPELQKLRSASTRVSPEPISMRMTVPKK